MLAYIGPCLYDQPGGDVRYSGAPNCPACHGWGFVVNIPKIDILGSFEPESVNEGLKACECSTPSIEEIGADEQSES